MIDRIKRRWDAWKKQRQEDALFAEIDARLEKIKVGGVTKADGTPVVLCLLRDGAYFISSFMEHYKKLGFTRFVFLDNASLDNSVELLSGYDVTIIRCPLPYSRFKWVYKQYLVKRYAANEWSLYVDIDELWDYPYSDKLPLRKFINYLDSNGYTAAMAHMLDMFAAEPLAELSKFADMPLKLAYPYYDNAGLIRKPYSKAYNRVSNPKTEHFWGGIHNLIFGIEDIYISKIPLVKWNKSISVHETSHTSTHISIADVSAVLLHYKFVYGFYEKANRVLTEGNYWNASKTYKQYLDAIEKNPQLSLYRNTAKRYVCAEQLLEDNFLMAGDKFMQYIEKENKG